MVAKIKNYLDMKFSKWDHLFENRPVTLKPVSTEDNDHHSQITY